MGVGLTAPVHSAAEGEGGDTNGYQADRPPSRTRRQRSVHTIQPLKLFLRTAVSLPEKVYEKEEEAFISDWKTVKGGAKSSVGDRSEMGKGGILPVESRVEVVKLVTVGFCLYCVMAWRL